MERPIAGSDRDGVCRLCLSSRGETQPIFPRGDGSEDPDLPVLAQKIRACVSVEINESDDLPTQICKKCVSNVNNWHIFKKVCNESQVKLRDWMNGESSAGSIQIKKEPYLDDSNDEDMAIDASYPGVEVMDRGEMRLQPEGPPILASLGLAPRNEKETTDHSAEDGSALVETAEVTRIPRRPVAVTQLASKDCLVCGRAYRYSHNARRHELTSHSYDRYTNKVDPAKKPATKLRPNPYNAGARLLPENLPTKMKLMPNISRKTVDSKSHPYPVRIRSMADLKMDGRQPEILKSLLTSRPEILVSEPEILRSASVSPENLVSEPEFAAFQVETIITEPDTYVSNFEDDSDDEHEDESDNDENDGDEDEENDDSHKGEPVSENENYEKPTKLSPSRSAADMESDCEVEISPNININDIIGVNTHDMPSDIQYEDTEEVVSHDEGDDDDDDDDDEEDDDDDEEDENLEDYKGSVDSKVRHKAIKNDTQESDDGEGYEEELDNNHIHYDDDDDPDEEIRAVSIVPIVEMNEEQTDETPEEDESHVENESQIEDDSQLDEDSQIHNGSKENHVNSVTVTSVQRNFMIKYRDLIEQINTMKCLCCNREYPRRKAVIQHLQKSGKRVPKHTCYNCVVTFGHIGALLSHMRANCCTNAWKLIYEEGGIPDSMIVEQSAKVKMLPNGQLQDDVLNKSQYKDILNARSYACKICNAKFQLKQIIMKHVLDVHENGGQRVPLVCIHCKYMFKDNKLWKKHVRNGECTVHIACDLCPEKFRMMQDFTNHALNVHAGSAIEPSNENLNRSVDDRPSSCPICKKVTANYHNLIKHLKFIHNEEKPHMCQHCDSKFALVTQLNQHIYQEHKQTGAPVETDGNVDLSIVKEEVTTYNYSCTECSSMFETVDGWTEHQITEHHHEAFACNQCDKRFLQDSDLQEHMNVHLKVKYYSCICCTNTYSSASKLSEHMIKAHDGASLPENLEDNPFFCDVCMRSFKSRQAFSNHMRIHAKVPTTNNRKSVNGDIIKSASPVNTVRVRSLPTNNVKKTTSVVPDAPYSCDICGKGFLHKKNIWKHKKMLHADIVNQSSDYITRQGDHFMNYSIEESEGFAGSDHGGLSIPQFDSFNTASFGTEQTENSGTDDNPQYQCDLCDKKFAVKSSIWKHKRVKHGIVNPNCQDEVSKPETAKISCTICKINFSDKKAYYRHRKNVHRANTQVCKICGMTLNSTMELYEHLKAAHAKELLGYNASQDVSLESRNEGERTTDEEGWEGDDRNQARYLCKACGECFPGAMALQNHSCAAGSDPNETFDCEICNKSYTSISALKSHRGWHLRSPDGKAAFSNSGLWMPQNRVTNKTSRFEVPETAVPRMERTTPYTEIPPLQIKRKLPPDVQLKLLKKKRFSSEVTVELVQTVPRVEAPAEDRYCEPCGKRFTKRAAYQRHVEEVHRPNSVFCPICGRSFTRKSTLLVHMRKHETVVNMSGPVDEDDREDEDGGEDPSEEPAKPAFSCDLCDVQYTTAKSLRRHCVRRHNVAAEDIVLEPPQRPIGSEFHCERCKQDFTSETELSQHRHYMCNLCKLYFTKSQYLAVHTRTVHAESHKMFFPCGMCDRFYMNKKSLQRHVDAAH